MRIRYSGSGGQGIVLVGLLTGQAAVADGRNAIQSQSYGSESRGGLCKSDVVVEDGDINDLELERVDLFVAMTQAAHDTYIGELEPAGSLVVDSGLVTAREGQPNLHAVPFTDIADRNLERKVAGNMVMLGYVVSAFAPVTDGAMREAIAKGAPEGTLEHNMRAYERGLELGGARAHRD